MLDDKLLGLELNTYEQYISPNTVFISDFGNNEFRLNWCDRITQAIRQLATRIHPTAYGSLKAVVNEGTVILPHAVVNTGSTNRACIINIGALVDHDCILEEAVHLARSNRER